MKFTNISLRAFVAALAVLLCLGSPPAAAERHGPPPHVKPATPPKPPRAEPKAPKPLPPQNHASAQLLKNPGLGSRLQPLLPPGTTLEAASSGFKNLGQFVAALHVARDLNIPFLDLKTKLVGPSAESLGRAIQQLRPEANEKVALKLAKLQTKEDIEGLKKGQTREEAKEAAKDVKEDRRVANEEARLMSQLWTSKPAKPRKPR